MTGTLAKGSAVMILRSDGGCLVVDTESASVEEFASALVLLRFQGWESNVPQELLQEATDILDRRRT